MSGRHYRDLDDEVPLHEQGSPHGRSRRLPPYGRESVPEIVTESPDGQRRQEKKKRPKFWKRPNLQARRGTLNNMQPIGDEDIENGKRDFGYSSLGKGSKGSGLKRIDYVLVHANKTLEETTSEDSRAELMKKMDMREKFERLLEEEESIEVQKDIIGETIVIKLHTPFDRLCKEAEKTKLQLPLTGCEIYDDGEPGCLSKTEDKYLVTDDEVDFVSAAFQVDKLQVFDGNENQNTFFRPALRSFLTHHILINMDIRSQARSDDDPSGKKGLPYLLLKEVYTDGYLLHDETVDDPAEKEEMEEKKAAFGSRFSLSGINFKDETELLNADTRKDLNDTWPKFYKYQPLWKIRNYFGEKIALYFAWSGMLISTLWIPTLFGLGVFFYGLYLSATDKIANPTPPNGTTAVDKVKVVVEDSINAVKASFDNDVTPYYALCICLWGTIFLEVWKRKNSTLAYEWDVDSFEDTENDRPQFFGTSKKADPVVPGEQHWYYPMTRQFLKFLTSCSMLVFMVMLVIISAAAVIVYRVIMSVDYCANSTPTNCLVISTVVSSLLNAVSILILGKLYDILAVKLTNWENHRTQTQYDDALIIKLFAFQFVNSYTTCFYIAFVRGHNLENGVLGMGSKYQDSCGEEENCMAMLSFQVLVLMLMKPFPKFLKDIVVPFLKKLWRKHLRKRLSCCCCKTKVDVSDRVHLHDYLERERLKPDLEDFTLGEYTEKVIVYGFLMLFAASFPLAPLIALLILLIDIRVDAKRMLWMYRRPVSFIAQDIGMWYGILQFINVVGVISNAFLIAFTSSWGAKYNTTEKLWIVIGFENIVFAMKFLIAWLIPDVPGPIKLARKKHIVFSVKFVMKAILPDVPATVRLNLKRHICFAVKFIITVVIPDVPHSVILAQKREHYQVLRIMEKAGGGPTPPAASRLSRRGAPILPEHRLDYSAPPPDRDVRHERNSRGYRDDQDYRNDRDDRDYRDDDIPKSGRKPKRGGSRKNSRQYDDEDSESYERGGDTGTDSAEYGENDYNNHDRGRSRRLAPIKSRKHHSRHSDSQAENPRYRRYSGPTDSMEHATDHVPESMSNTAARGLPHHTSVHIMSAPTDIADNGGVPLPAGGSTAVDLSLGGATNRAAADGGVVSSSVSPYKENISYGEGGETYLGREDKFVNPYYADEPRYDKRGLYGIPETPRPVVTSRASRYSHRYDDDYEDESAA